MRWYGTNRILPLRSPFVRILPPFIGISITFLRQHGTCRGPAIPIAEDEVDIAIVFFTRPFNIQTSSARPGMTYAIHAQDGAVDVRDVWATEKSGHPRKADYGGQV